MEAKLVIVSGASKAAEFKLKLPTVIGRSRNVDLPLGHSLVSRQHCELFEDNGVLKLRDLGSLNGTFLGEERVTEEVELAPGSQFTVGPVTFRAVYGEMAAADDPSDASDFSATAVLPPRVSSSSVNIPAGAPSPVESPAGTTSGSKASRAESDETVPAPAAVSRAGARAPDAAQAAANNIGELTIDWTGGGAAAGPAEGELADADAEAPFSFLEASAASTEEPQSPEEDEAAEDEAQADVPVEDNALKDSAVIDSAELAPADEAEEFIPPAPAAVASGEFDWLQDGAEPPAQDTAFDMGEPIADKAPAEEANKVAAKAKSPEKPARGKPGLFGKAGLFGKPGAGRAATNKGEAKAAPAPEPEADPAPLSVPPAAENHIDDEPFALPEPHSPAGTADSTLGNALDFLE